MSSANLERLGRIRDYATAIYIAHNSQQASQQRLMREQGWYSEDRVKDGGDEKKVAVYHKKEFAHARQVSKEHNMMRFQVGYPSGT